MVGTDPSWNNLYKEIQYHPNNKLFDKIIEKTTTFQKQERKKKRYTVRFMLGLVPLNPIIWCYVCYSVWHCVWLNVVINKVSLLLSKIMVTWIFGHYHIVHEMHSMWFSHRKYRSQVLCKLIILVRSRWWNWTFHLRRL